MQHRSGRIRHNLYFKEEIVGKGAFGSVYRGVLYEKKRFCAIAIKELEDVTDDAIEGLLLEAVSICDAGFPNNNFRSPLSQE